MKKEKYQYIYGPVSSWRLGVSLGIDPLSAREKICSFDCIYCQLGETFHFEKERRAYLKTDEVVEELNRFPGVPIDYITFSGSGEPTLAGNLGGMIAAVKSCRNEKIAVLTNSSLIMRGDVRTDLSLADFVIAKLDACSEDSLQRINKPVPGIDFESIFQGLKEFRAGYHGKFALQIMFMEENRDDSYKLADLAHEIEPDEVQINTPLRPCAVQPLSPEEISVIKEKFVGLNPITVYEKEKKETSPVSSEDTLKRRGKVV
jgi:wyosine [tRNA(Phe)-imidazoG37] synthetase (radical SAM superfamily)